MRNIVTSGSGSGAGAVGGATSFGVNPAALIPRATGGSGINSSQSATHNVNLDLLEFDAATEQHAQILLEFPNNWDGGAFAVEPRWGSTGGSGGVALGFSARVYADGDDIDQALGTEQVTTDTHIGANKFQFAPACPAVTPAGTLSADRPVMLNIARKVAHASDTLGTVLQLQSLRITYNL